MSAAASTILLAGGGTGGHISPGLALAEQFAMIAPDAPRLFACSERAIDARMLNSAGERFIALPAAPFGLRPRALWRFIQRWRRSVHLSTEMLTKERVGLVIALGGFVAAPMISAAKRAGVPSFMLNLDVIPGKANRWLARRCDRVISAVETPKHRAFAEQVVGLPLRSRAVARQQPPACRAALGLDPDRPTLFITGASQGAATLNELGLLLAREHADLLATWQVLHLAGPERAGGLEAGYRATGVRAMVIPFLDDMSIAWGATDLAISRAGANSVAEAWANRVPTIFLPYPWHRDRHQYANAEPMTRTGGALIADDLLSAPKTLSRLLPRLRPLLTDSARRDLMRTALGDSPHLHAAEVIARMALEMRMNRGGNG